MALYALVFGQDQKRITIGVLFEKEKISELDTELKELISKSSLPEDKKEIMYKLLDETKRKAEANEYGNKNDGHVGMFGSGFMTFDKAGTDNSLPQEFIKMCIDISDIDNDWDMFERANESFKKGLKGIQSGTASTFLHCLKPLLFLL